MASGTIRVGLGHDTHRLQQGGRLVLGGVEVAGPWGAVGHSDADVLLHAVIDAILGAAGLGDIGTWFPDSEPRWKDADSAELLETVLKEVHQRGWRVNNLDAVIFAEQPRLESVKPQIRKRVAELLAIPAEVVNIKAKSGEKVGPIGRGEAIAAEVVVLLAQEGS